MARLKPFPPKAGVRGFSQKLRVLRFFSFEEPLAATPAICAANF